MPSSCAALITVTLLGAARARSQTVAASDPASPNAANTRVNAGSATANNITSNITLTADLTAISGSGAALLDVRGAKALSANVVSFARSTVQNTVRSHAISRSRWIQPMPVSSEPVGKMARVLHG